MELNSNAAIEVLGQYMTAKSEEAEAKANRGFVSIDLDVNQMYSTAAANIQQKAANLRSTLRQSLRRQKSTGRSHTAIDHLFDDVPPGSDSRNDMTSELSNVSIHPHQTVGQSVSSSAKEDSRENAPTNKTMIDTIPKDAPTPATQAITSVASSTSLSDKAISDNAPFSDDEPMSLSMPPRRVMRSMSRRSRTQSAGGNVNSVQQMFQQQGESTQQQFEQDQLALPGEPSGNRRNESGYFSSIRSRDPHVLENLTNSSGSVRRLTRDSLADDPQAPVIGRVRRPSGPLVQEIVGWWQNEASSTSPPNTIVSPRASISSPVSYVPRVSSGSATVSGKTQVSSFDTSVSHRRNSTNTKQRASTLGRSTTKQPSNFNSVKTLRGLFDNAGSKVAPESEKTQLTSIHDAKVEEVKPVMMKTTTTLINKDRVAASTKYSLPEFDDDTNAKENRAKKGGEVDTIRRMLQATWQSSIKESGSLSSLRVDSINDLASLAEDTPVRHASPAIERAMQEEPKPATPFSSPTAHRTSKIASTLDTVATPRSTAEWDEESFLQANSSTPRIDRRPLSGGHSRKSSGDNSTGTVLRIGPHAGTAQTWNGRIKKPRPSVLPSKGGVFDSEYSISPTMSYTMSNRSKKKYFSTMHKGRRQQRNGLPMWPADDNEKTPAQLERDRYLGSYYDDQRAFEDDYDQRASWTTIRPI